MRFGKVHTQHRQWLWILGTSPRMTISVEAGCDDIHWNCIKQQPLHNYTLCHPRPCAWDPYIAALANKLSVFDEYGIDSLELMRKIHGHRISKHQDFDTAHAWLELILKSLIETGDIEKTESGYVVTGKSLTTIAQYEEENRRNKTQTRLNVILVFLTAIIAFATVFQTLF